MSPTMVRGMEVFDSDKEDQSKYHKGVKLLCDTGITKVPRKYILPFPERPATIMMTHKGPLSSSKLLKLPLIDLSELRGPNRSQVIKSLSNACKSYGFFQVVNHGVPEKVINNMIDVGGRFFELPYDVRSKYMSLDMRAPVRYGTSFNQNKDGVFCWRDFLKFICDPSPDILARWPDSPVNFRECAYSYSKEIKNLFVELTHTILESLGLMDNSSNAADDVDDGIVKEFENGSQLMVVNCYPKCPQPQLTLGMPPHSDFGFLTLLLQDEVRGLQIQHQDDWVTVDPVPGSFVVNVGDHLEIFSNGLYKSVLHRVLANSERPRMSIASLHSLPFSRTVRPSPALVNLHGQKSYRDTNFADFLEYVSAQEPKGKDFLEFRKLT